jgi:hypothetical protein
MNTLRFQDWPPFLRAMRDEGYRPRPVPFDGPTGLYRFAVNVAGWKLRFPDDVPLFYASEVEISNVTDFDLLDIVRDAFRKNRLAQDAFLLLGRNACVIKEEFAKALYPKIIVIDPSDQQSISRAHSFDRALLTLVVGRYKLTDLAPYHIGGRATRFFGRKTELNRILRHDDANYLITGIRRVGKTFLLQEAMRLMAAAAPDAPSPIFLDCTSFASADDFVRTLVREISVREFMAYERRGWHSFDARRFLRQHGRSGRRVVLLDECDQLLQIARKSVDLRDLIRASTNEGSCRYVMAGFYDLKAEMTRATSPLYIAADPFFLEPFAEEITHEMVIAPLATLGVKFEDADATVSRIQHDTRGMPPLVQFYCRELTALVEERGDRTIYTDDVRHLHTRPELKTLVVDSFRDSASKADQLLVYILLHRIGGDREAYSLEDVYNAAHAIGWSIDLADVDRACDRLLVSGFLAGDAKAFRFAAPVFAKLMTRNYNLAFMIRALRQELGI